MIEEDREASSLHMRMHTSTHTGVCMAPPLQALEWDQEDMQDMKEESNRQEYKTKEKVHLKFWKGEFKLNWKFNWKLYQSAGKKYKTDYQGLKIKGTQVTAFR